ncbi:cytochrome bd-I oxidase subunit CydX [Xenorhabdus koppenhoeferi]|uniref:Cyd operon protein YbgT n=1 Tax=Xenorhabdus koppenhoeferi TaxID=351659 RepID=A0A1I7J7J1_9GAMM|nr:cytochrome bd-I oxidase subunit CydX [Xenorhabdus koppenhoeferi]SFU81104.1 cyd operon protein YbgT [Xenorhabdus koppenhoeferi]
MWYFAWILGTLLACSFAIIAVLALEHSESKKSD